MSLIKKSLPGIICISLILLISFIMISYGKEKTSQYLHMSEVEEYKKNE